MPQVHVVLLPPFNCTRWVLKNSSYEKKPSRFLNVIRLIIIIITLFSEVDFKVLHLQIYK